MICSQYRQLSSLTELHEQEQAFISPGLVSFARMTTLEIPRASESTTSADQELEGMPR